MRKIKSFILFTFIMLMLLSLSGCKGTFLYGELFVKKRDINGPEDTSLAIYTEEDIRTPDLLGHSSTFGFSSDEKYSYPKEELLWDGDFTSASSITGYSGSATLQMTYGKTDVIEFTVTPTLKKGNMRIVLLDQDFNILYDFATDRESSFEVTGAKGKYFEVRAVGEAARFAITTKRELK